MLTFLPLSNFCEIGEAKRGSLPPPREKLSQAIDDAYSPLPLPGAVRAYFFRARIYGGVVCGSPSSSCLVPNLICSLPSYGRWPS